MWPTSGPQPFGWSMRSRTNPSACSKTGPRFILLSMSHSWRHPPEVPRGVRFSRSGPVLTPAAKPPSACRAAAMGLPPIRPSACRGIAAAPAPKPPTVCRACCPPSGDRATEPLPSGALRCQPTIGPAAGLLSDGIAAPHWWQRADCPPLSGIASADEQRVVLRRARPSVVASFDDLLLAEISHNVIDVLFTPDFGENPFVQSLPANRTSIDLSQDPSPQRAEIWFWLDQ
jgi:hypothetical protein